MFGFIDYIVVNAHWLAYLLPLLFVFLCILLRLQCH